MKEVSGQEFRWSHRVERWAFLQSSELGWDSPIPSPACECVPPWGGGRGGRRRGYTRLRERGWEAQFRRGDRHWCTLGIYFFTGLLYFFSFYGTWVDSLVMLRNMCLYSMHSNCVILMHHVLRSPSLLKLWVYYERLYKSLRAYDSGETHKL